MQSNDFHLVKPKPIGTHSFRKFPATLAKRHGCKRDEINCRGRWRIQRGQIVDRYIDIEMPAADAKVASALCVGGTIRYKLLEGSGISEHWLKTNVVPNMLLKFSCQVSLVLALPLLWACFDPAMENRIPASIRNRVHAAYENIRQLPENVNPIIKVPQLVYRVDDNFFVVDNNQAMVDGNGQAVVPPQPLEEQLTALTSEVHQLRTDLMQHRSASEAAQSNFHQAIERHFSRLQANVRRLVIAPARRREQEPTSEGDSAPNAPADHVVGANAVLSPLPRSLYDLWNEYQFGIGGRKPAKDFTPNERGRVKHNYARRKVVWEKVDELVRRGYTAEVAIDRIYNVYGRSQSVTKIIDAMKVDRRNGGHANLRH